MIAKKGLKKSCLGASESPFGRGLGALGRLWGVLGRFLGALGRLVAGLGWILGTCWLPGTLQASILKGSGTCRVGFWMP